MTEMDSSRIPMDLIIKLFDTLKESNTDLKANVNKQTDAIVHLSSLLKEGVTLDELKRILDEHNTHAGKHLDTIDTCTESIQDNSGKILSTLSRMGKRVNTMIIVVVVTFSLMAISYLFVSSSVENMIKTEIKKSVSTEESYIYDPGHNQITHQIDELRQMIENLRKDNKNGLNKTN
jgi:DNA-binding transcriptional MerR regulator